MTKNFNDVPESSDWKIVAIRVRDTLAATHTRSYIGVFADGAAILHANSKV